jgi:hypothetical protein
LVGTPLQIAIGKESIDEIFELINLDEPTIEN